MILLSKRRSEKNFVNCLEPNKMKLLMENWRRFLKEDASPTKLDPERFPTKLSDVAEDPKDAQGDATMGGQDADPTGTDDRIGVNGGTWSVSELGPSQSTMKIGQAVGMAVQAILKGKDGGNLGAIISSDGRIMDGHHRWISSYMVDPNAKIGGYAVNFPAKQLIPVLNAITVGKIGRLTGKEGKGSFNDFNENEIQKELAKLWQNGIPDYGPESPAVPAENIQAGLQKWSGTQGENAIAATAAKMADNISSAKMDRPEGAPDRVDMPVIDKKDIYNAIGLLQKGLVDVNPPYHDQRNEKEDTQ